MNTPCDIGCSKEILKKLSNGLNVRYARGGCVKSTSTFVTAIWLRAARGGGGVYVNLGVAFRHSQMLSLDNWDAAEWLARWRAEWIAGPFQVTFRSLALPEVAREELVTAEEVERALGWALTWLDGFHGDLKDVARAVLDPGSWVGLSPGTPLGRFGEWAMAQVDGSHR
jgi:hypothetical protein